MNVTPCLLPILRQTVVVGALLSFSPSLMAAPTSFEAGTDRPGIDYWHGPIGSDPTICKSMCENDTRCQAYTYVHPGFQGASAVCWLKSAAPGPVESDCCVSGTKQVTFEVGWNRLGSDYRHFTMAYDAPAQDCRSACVGDTRCRAYTFVSPPLQGPLPVCWLKYNMPAPTEATGMVSGIVNWR